jgi:drug/metabolite transporter (DMT)-like permease
MQVRLGHLRLQQPRARAPVFLATSHFFSPCRIRRAPHTLLLMFSKRLRADAALVFCSLVWGCTFVLVKDALADVSVFVYLAVRFAFSALILAIVFRDGLRQLHKDAIWAGAQIGLFMAGGYAFQTAGLQFTSPSKAAFITGCAVVLVPILLTFFGRRINSWVWAGVAAALVGLYFLTVPPEGFGELNRGDVLVFGCAIMFALQLIFIGRYVERHSVGSLAFLQVATTALVSSALVPVSAAVHWESPRLVWTGTLISALLITSIGSTVMGFSFLVWAQKHTSSTHAAILLTPEPVFAALTSWLYAHEIMTARGLAGGALILMGILIAELKGSTHLAPAPPASTAYPAER